MKYFTKLDYPAFSAMLPELTRLLDENMVSWNSNQICLNTLPTHPTDFHLGVGSLDRDWGNATTTENKLSQKVTVNKKTSSVTEKDFTYLCDVFRGTVFEEVYNFLQDRYTLGRVRLMKIDPKRCMSWHYDYNKRVHYAVSTFTGAHLVVEDEVKFLELDSWYLVDTTKRHTAFNGSMQSRIHLVASIYD
jgi:hypothetical protein